MSDSEMKSVNTSGYVITQEMLNSVENKFLDMKDATVGSKFYFLAGEYDQIVLQQLYDVLSEDGQDDPEKTKKLLNMCMLSSTPVANEDGTYYVISGVTRTSDDNGNYTYKIRGVTREYDEENKKYIYEAEDENTETITKAEFDAAFTKVDACKRLALPYFAMAIMYEKVCIQQMVLVEQLEQIEKINNEIEENNKMLKALSWMYDNVYENVTLKGAGYKFGMIQSSDLEDKTGTSLEDLHSYLKNKVQNGGFFESVPKELALSLVIGYAKPYAYGNGLSGNKVIYYAKSHFDRDGNDLKGVQDDKNEKQTENIDVHEQAVLTMLSNFQDQTRMYGDQLSTDANLMTTKMQQYMQDANASVSACTQVVKSIGEYYKTITSNIR